MWKTVLPDYNTNWEPLELRSLKRQLANLNCKCRSCEKTKKFFVDRPLEEQNDREIQAVPSKNFLDSFVQATVSPNFPRDIGKLYFPEEIRDDISCPSCYVTLNLLRAGFAKVLKDEEIETKHDMFSCDKSTEKIVNSLEKTTSLTIRPALKHSNLSISDHITDRTSQSILSPRKSSHREVTFLLENETGSMDEREPQQFSFDTLVGNCICVDDYIDCIRPPWIDRM